MTANKSQIETPPPTTKDPLEGLVVGRMVYYHPHPHESRNAAEGPWAAIVTAISAEMPGVVTLNVQLPSSRPVGNDPVDRFEKVPFGTEAGCWSWMFEGQNTRYKPDRTA